MFISLCFHKFFLLFVFVLLRPPLILRGDLPGLLCLRSRIRFFDYFVRCVFFTLSFEKDRMVEAHLCGCDLKYLRLCQILCIFLPNALIMEIKLGLSEMY